MRLDIKKEKMKKSKEEEAKKSNARVETMTKCFKIEKSDNLYAPLKVNHQKISTFIFSSKSTFSVV